jgi:hypothetical protein
LASWANARQRFYMPLGIARALGKSLVVFDGF